MSDKCNCGYYQKQASHRIGGGDCEHYYIQQARLIASKQQCGSWRKRSGGFL